MIVNLTDEELFERLKQKDDHLAFQTIYERHSKRIFAYCLRSMGNSDAAKDIFQKVLTKIYEKRDSFNGGNLLAWMMIITRNEVLMEKRSHKFTEDIADYEHLIGNSDSNQDFKLNEIVFNSLAELNKELREVIEMRYFDELSYDEIAEITGASMALVKVRLHRAKAQLLKKLHSLKEELI